MGKIKLDELVERSGDMGNLIDWVSENQHDYTLIPNSEIPEWREVDSEIQPEEFKYVYVASVRVGVVDGYLHRDGEFKYADDDYDESEDPITHWQAKHEEPGSPLC